MLSAISDPVPVIINPFRFLSIDKKVSPIDWRWNGDICNQPDPGAPKVRKYFSIDFTVCRMRRVDWVSIWWGRFQSKWFDNMISSKVTSCRWTTESKSINWSDCVRLWIKFPPARPAAQVTTFYQLFICFPSPPTADCAFITAHFVFKLSLFLTTEQLKPGMALNAFR